MAAHTKPTLVIVSGGWHVPESYEKLTTALQFNGYEVHVPRLPSTAPVRPPNADLSTDTEFIRSFVENLVENGHVVMAIMHSYGGQVGTNALYGLGVRARSARGLKGGISHLVYVTASAGLEGSSLETIGVAEDDQDVVSLVFDIAEDGSCLARDFRALVGPGCSDAETDAYISTLVRWNSRGLWQPLQHCAWRDIPVVYIYTTADAMLPLEHQKSFVEDMEKTGVKVQTFELATGHCPNFTATQGLVDAINQIGAR